jgi:histone acetyltransferase
MECHINSRISYLDLAATIARQRAFIHSQIQKISRSHIVHPGITSWKPDPSNAEKVIPIEISLIPGVVEAGWTAENWAKLNQNSAGSQQNAANSTGNNSTSAVPTQFEAKLGLVLKNLRQQKDAWPFLEPVDSRVVTDYLSIIKLPMDLKTMSEKLDNHSYQTKEEFIADFKLIIANCKQYNSPDSTYVKAAEHLDTIFDRKIEQQFRERTGGP